jgi:hypothetical protein
MAAQQPSPRATTTGVVARGEWVSVLFAAAGRHAIVEEFAALVARPSGVVRGTKQSRRWACGRRCRPQSCGCNSCVIHVQLDHGGTCPRPSHPNDK